MTSITFRPYLVGADPDGIGDTDIQAEATAYGLALHRGFDFYLNPGLIEAITISDPVTGFRVAGGDSRDQALRDLDELVIRMGGPEQFAQTLAERRAGVLALREQHAREHADINSGVAAVLHPEYVQ